MEQQEIERNIQFIVAQQAQFVTDLQQLRETQAEQQGHISKLTDALLTVTGLVGRLIEAQDRLAQQEAERSKRHAEFEERFNAFVAFMERYLDGKGKGQH